MAAILVWLGAPRQFDFWPKLFFMMAKRSQVLPEVKDLEKYTRRRRQGPLESP
jgi:hypothetical protein